MLSLRQLIKLLVTFALATLALPGLAADKLFALNASVTNAAGAATGGVIPAGAVSMVLLDFANQSPTGANSVINSIQVAVPADVTYKIVQSSTTNNGSCPAAPAAPATMPTPNATGGTLQLNNIQGVKPRGHFCLYLAVTTSLNACTVAQWTGYANTGNTFNGGVSFTDPRTGQLFSVTTTSDGCTGILGCASGSNTGGNPNIDPNVDTTPDWGLVRGNNSDGSTCTLVPYTFTLDAASSTSSFIPIKGGQAVAVKYMVLFAPRPVDPYPTTYDASATTAGWTNGRPQLAWVTDNNGPVYVPALACVTDDVNDGAAALPKIPNTDPFKAYATMGAPYNAYAPGNPALMCVAQLGWTSAGKDTVTGRTLVQYWVKVIDEADGFMNFP